MASCCFASIQALRVGLSRGEDKNKLEGVRNPALHARSAAVFSEMVKEEATKESAMEELEELHLSWRRDLCSIFVGLLLGAEVGEQSKSPQRVRFLHFQFRGRQTYRTA